MADKGTAPTNGEFYDDARKTWCVWCGPTAVPIRKQDASGQPVPPPAQQGAGELDNLVSST